MARMSKKLARILRDERGFTLVELLIVVAILGVLVAVVLVNVTGLVGSGQTEAARLELNQVQTAMDIMMIKKKLTSVTAVTTPTNDMTKFPDTTNPLYPEFLRTATTKGTYTCTSTGQVTQVSTGY